MRITIVMKKTHQLSLRVSELAKKLLLAEQKSTNESESDIVERCLIQCIRSPEALKLIREYAAEDPTLAAILAAIQAAPASNHKNKTGPKSSQNRLRHTKNQEAAES